MLMEAAGIEMAKTRRGVRRPKLGLEGAMLGRGDIGAVEIPNPFRLRVPDLKISSVGEIAYHEDRITVVTAFRDDPLGRLYAHKQISKSQHKAGRAWQRMYEDAEVGRIGSIDTAKTPVDGTKQFPEPITDRMRKAITRLAELDGALGHEGRALVRDVLGSGMHMRQVAQRRSQTPSEAMTRYYGHRLRECLSTLARELGYCS